MTGELPLQFMTTINAWSSTTGRPTISRGPRRRCKRPACRSPSSSAWSLGASETPAEPADAGSLRLPNSQSGSLSLGHLEAQIAGVDRWGYLVPVRWKVFERQLKGSCFAGLQRYRSSRDWVRRFAQDHLTQHVVKFQLQIQSPDRPPPTVRDLSIEIDNAIAD